MVIGISLYGRPLTKKEFNKKIEHNKRIKKLPKDRINEDKLWIDDYLAALQELNEDGI